VRELATSGRGQNAFMDDLVPNEVHPLNMGFGHDVNWPDPRGSVRSL
jgi:hypothetical protein